MLGEQLIKPDQQHGEVEHVVPIYVWSCMPECVNVYVVAIAIFYYIKHQNHLFC